LAGRKPRTAIEHGEGGLALAWACASGVAAPRIVPRRTATLRWQQDGALVAKILKGAKPSDLPVEQPSKFELVINIKTATAQGLSVSNQMQLLADQVID
jgi:hypothetical protein